MRRLVWFIFLMAFLKFLFFENFMHDTQYPLPPPTVWEFPTHTSTSQPHSIKKNNDDDTSAGPLSASLPSVYHGEHGQIGPELRREICWEASLNSYWDYGWFFQLSALVVHICALLGIRNHRPHPLLGADCYVCSGFKNRGTFHCFSVSFSTPLSLSQQRHPSCWFLLVTL